MARKNTVKATIGNTKKKGTDSKSILKGYERIIENDYLGTNVSNVELDRNGGVRNVNGYSMLEELMYS